MIKIIFKTAVFFIIWQIVIFVSTFIPAYFLVGWGYISTTTLGLEVLPFVVTFLTGLFFFKRRKLKPEELRYRYFLYPLSLAAVIPTGMFYTTELYLEYSFYITYLTSVILTSGLLMLYLLLGILVAFCCNKIIGENSRFRFLKFAGLLLLFSVAAAFIVKPIFTGCCRLGSLRRVEVTKETDAASLKESGFTPVLDEKIIPGRNLVWCATYQLCWDDLIGFLGKPVTPLPPLELAKKLNAERFDTKWIDDFTYIAQMSDKKMDFTEALDKKFGKTAAPLLLKKMPKEDPLRIFFYSYLECSLPFEWAFQRSDYAMLFCEKDKVEAFGLRGYNPLNEKEQKCIEQIVVKYCENDEAVIELKTKKAEHHLILAKVTPQKTLGETVEYVNKLIKKGSEYKYYYEGDAVIEIPVIDFDLINKYDQLCNLKIEDNMTIEESVQRIKFRLDESGAFVLSEAYLCLGLGGGPVKHLIFNKPFLLMLKYKDAEMPYFAVWIGNAELLKRTDKQTIQEYYMSKRNSR